MCLWHWQILSNGANQNISWSNSSTYCSEKKGPVTSSKSSIRWIKKTSETRDRNRRRFENAYCFRTNQMVKKKV